MKHWQELARILDRVLDLEQSTVPARAGPLAALAVVVRIHGSAYRRPGAKLLIEGGGSTLGGVSGGCLEEDVRQVGLEVIEQGGVRLRHYDTREDEAKLWGLGLGCDGEVDVLVAPLLSDHVAELWRPVRKALDGDAPFVLSTLVAAQGRGAWQLEAGMVRKSTFAAEHGVEPGELARSAEATLAGRRSQLVEIGARRVFHEVLMPPPKLVVFGAGDDAQPLVTAGAAAGFRVVVVDHRPALATGARFPEAERVLLLRPDEASDELPLGAETYAVIKMHSLQHDTEWARRVAGGNAAYIGVLGPRSRIEKVRRTAGLETEARIYGPVGLDIGSDGPEQVAFSIVAEALAVRARRRPAHLRDRTEPMHES